jgi:hypothetical protein
MLKCVFGTRKNEAAWSCRKSYDEQLCNLCPTRCQKGGRVKECVMNRL